MLPLRETLRQTDLNHRIIEHNSDCLGLVNHVDDILAIFKRGKIASMIGSKGLH